jgi:hypothetical protein
MNKLTRDHQYKLDEQMSHTHLEADAKRVPGIISSSLLLNKLRINPFSKHAALVLTKKLLDKG